MNGVQHGLQVQLAGHAYAASGGRLCARLRNEQEPEGFSIRSQLKLLRGHAQACDIELVSEFVDVETAKEPGRANLSEMVSFLKRQRDCHLLLVEKTDRLYRNLKDWVSIDDLDLEIHFVKENVVLSPDSRSTGKFMHGIRVLTAKN